MTRLFKKKLERKKGIWKRVVDLALTDVRVESTTTPLRVWKSGSLRPILVFRRRCGSSTARKKPSVEGRHVAPRA